MYDPRIRALAKVLVEFSASIETGDRVLIQAQPVAEPLVLQLVEAILKAGGHPHVLIRPPSLGEIFLAHANEDQLTLPPAFELQAYREFESRIRIHSLTNTRSLSNVDPGRMQLAARAWEPILSAQFDRGGRGEFKWVTTLYPTQAYAQDAGMSLTEFEQFAYRGCHVDDPSADAIKYWNDLELGNQRFIQMLEGHDQVRVQSPSCELTFSIKGRTFLGGCRHNMPDGEVFTGPVEESAQGWIRFQYPSIVGGSEIDGIELEFDEGKVVSARARTNDALLQARLETDAGSRYIGEFGIGTNYGIQRYTGHGLFDEKIGGTIHFALGRGYPETGSKNQSSIHWDLITEFREDSRIIADGQIVYENGAFRE